MFNLKVVGFTEKSPNEHFNKSGRHFFAQVKSGQNIEENKEGVNNDLKGKDGFKRNEDVG